MNPIAQTAYAALDRAMGANSAGEIPDHGPEWACERFGKYGHNFYNCRECIGNFMTLNDETKGASK